MANVSVSQFFVFATVQVGQVTMFLKTSNKTDVILCSAIFYLYINGKCHTPLMSYPDISNYTQHS